MKIEIVPEGNKTKKEDGGFDFAFIFDMIFGKLGSFVENIFENVVSAVEAALSSAIRKLFAGVLAVLGLLFLLFGFAELLDYAYRIPGIGSVIVGIVVFIIAVIVMLTADRRRK